VRNANAATLSSFDLPTAGGKTIPAQGVKLDQAAVEQMLALYAEISGRSVIRAPNLPEAKVTFSNQTPMSSVQVLQALDTVLAAHGIAMVVLGTQYVKAVPAKEANLEAGPVIERKAEELPDSSSFMIYIVKLKSGTARQVVPAIQPFAKLPNSIMAISSDGGQRSSKASLPELSKNLFGTKEDVLILRDYSSNVRRMLQVLANIEDK
jgi:type II secretory pathway component GspD/PulD (secretin)